MLTRCWTAVLGAQLQEVEPTRHILTSTCLSPARYRYLSIIHAFIKVFIANAHSCSQHALRYSIHVSVGTAPYESKQKTSSIGYDYATFKCCFPGTYALSIWRMQARRLRVAARSCRRHCLAYMYVWLNLPKQDTQEPSGLFDFTKETRVLQCRTSLHPDRSPSQLRNGVPHILFALVASYPDIFMPFEIFADPLPMLR